MNPAHQSQIYVSVGSGEPEPEGTPNDLRHILKTLDLSSRVESNFHDGSHGLFSLYNDKTAEYDKHLADNWTEGARDLMVLGGLISAAIAAFLSSSFLASRITSQDVSALYLGYLFELQANGNNVSV